VQAVLASRIDRLPAAEKELLQTLAVLGREFALTLVERVTLKSSDELEQLMTSLQLGEFIHEQPAVAEIEYSFKHALTQEVAYNSLLAERRRAIHEQAARAIEAIYTSQLEDQYADLAHHYLRSSDVMKALQYARLRAEQAIEHGAYAEAESTTNAALKLIEKLPEDIDLQRGELELRGVQSMVERALHGMASADNDRAIRRMCELGEKLGESKQLLRAVLALSTLHFSRGEATRGLEVALRGIGLAESIEDARLLADAYHRAGTLAHNCGNLRKAVAYFEDAIRYAGRADHNLSTFGFSFKSLLPTSLALDLQMLGHSDNAGELADQGLIHARESKRLYDLGLVLAVTDAVFRCYRREPELVRVRTEEAIELSENNGFTEWLHFGRFFHGWSLAELGQSEQGIAEMETGIAGFRGMGGVSPQQYAIALLARAYAGIHRMADAMTLLNDALMHIERTGENYHKAEMLRLQGEMILLRDAGATDQAEACFRNSLEVTRTQEARWWELRATTSLARLLRDTGKPHEARSMLAEIHNWFTEGFELPDLKEAKALLDELGV
jgi:tetratricopeptide (TPR) repeat protein